MTTTLFWRVRTKDFGTWINPDAQGLAEMMRSQGVLSQSLHRDTDDPNSVTIVMEFEDRSAVDAFEAWYAPMKEEWFAQFPGSEHEVIDRWVGGEVPGYTW